MASTPPLAPGTRAACRVGRWSGPLVTVLAIAIPVLWFTREREVRALRAELAEVRAYAEEIEQGLSMVGGRQRPKRRRRHLVSVTGGTAVAVFLFTAVLPAVAEVLS